MGPVGPPGPPGPTGPTGPQGAQGTPGDASGLLVAHNLGRHPTLYARDYGVAADGVTDDAGALQAAVAAAGAWGPRGATVVLPQGEIRLASAGGVAIPDNVHLVADDPGRTVLVQAAWGSWGWQGMGPALHAYGSVGEPVALTADAVPGQATLSVTSTAGLVAGAVVLLTSTVAHNVEDGAAVKRGEQLRIASVDSATQVTVRGVVRDTYTAATSSVRAVSPRRGITLEGFTIRNAEPLLHASHMVGFAFAQAVAVRGVHTLQGDSAGIDLTHVLEAVVEDCESRDHADVPASNRFGYGVQVNGGSEGIRVRNCLAVSTRHAVTTTGDVAYGGVPRDVLVSGCVSRHGKHVSFDTHAGSALVTFSGCASSHNPHAGFTLRGQETTVLGCTSTWDADGIRVYPDAHNSVIKGNVIRHTLGASNGTGVFVFRRTATNIDHRVTGLQIVDNDISHTARWGVMFEHHAEDFQVMRNRFKAWGMASGDSCINLGGNLANGFTAGRLIGNVFSRTGPSGRVPGSNAAAANWPFQVVTAGTCSNVHARDNTGVGTAAAWVTGSGSAGIQLTNNAILT